MRRQVFLTGHVAITLSSWVDLSACGDKFLRVGRSGRFQRYASVHPSTILIYSPANSTRAGIDELKALLKRAGHKAIAVERTASLSATLATSAFDLVIADHTDLDRLRADLQSASSRAAILPIVNVTSKASNAA